VTDRQILLTIFILGEVNRSAPVSLRGQLTAETAVAIAGGFTPRALHTQVDVRRTVAGRRSAAVRRRARRYGPATP